MTDEIIDNLAKYPGKYKFRMGLPMYLHVNLEDDTLVVQSKDISLTKLVSLSEKEFASTDGRINLTFKRFDDGYPQSIILKRDEPGEDEIFDRLVQLDTQFESSSPIDLGWLYLCLTTNDWGATKNFYTNLGFTPVGPIKGIRQGWSTITFFDFEVVPFTFRGPNLRILAKQLMSRGLELLTSLKPDGKIISELPVDGSGNFILSDPDGNGIFFNTHPSELKQYNIWIKDKQDNAMRQLLGGKTSQLLPLGQMVLCLGVQDLIKSQEFYQSLGFTVILESDNTITLHTIPPHADNSTFPEYFLIRLHKANTSELLLGFLCDNSNEVVDQIKQLGFDIVNTSQGLGVRDPDGHVLVFLENNR